MSESLTLISIEEFVHRALVVPFVSKGQDYNGWDCYSLVRIAYRDVFGIALPDYSEDYQDAGDTMESRIHLRGLVTANIGRYQQVDRPEPGDVVVLNIAGRPIHLGLAIDSERFLHTERRINTVIERLASPMWAKRIEGFYRYG